MSQAGWEATIFTGNPDADRQTVEQQRQTAASQGLDLEVQPLGSGGYHVRAVPRIYGGFATQPQQAYAGAGGAPVVVGGNASRPVAAIADTPERVVYIRKVYGLLFAAAMLAIGAGMAAIYAGPMTSINVGHKSVHVSMLVAAMLHSRILWFVAFGALFVSTMIAGAVSKVKGLNVVALFGVSILMGVEIAPMIFVANVMSGLGHTMSAAPVRDAFALTGAVFVGITAYVYVTRKDFSFLYASLAAGFWVVFAASILAMFFHSEILWLAISTVGALIAAGFLLMHTSRIFRANRYDNAVGDALGLLVQLRNLFMFLLRILMSSRR